MAIDGDDGRSGDDDYDVPKNSFTKFFCSRLNAISSSSMFKTWLSRTLGWLLWLLSRSVT